MSQITHKRLAKEIKQLAISPPPNVKLEDFNDIQSVTVSLRGAEGTLYAGEDFRLKFKFSENYPLEPPEVTFLPTHIPVHPHVYSNGHICLSILADQWSPALTVIAPRRNIPPIMIDMFQRIAERVQKKRNGGSMMIKYNRLDISRPKDFYSKKEDQKCPSTAVLRPIDFSIDLGHLAVFDINNLSGITSEADIRGNVRDCVQSLINSVWTLPTRSSEDHTTVLATLPSPTTQLPREKAMPKVKPMTRWERFAKEKGIQKKKRSRLVYDDEQADWIPRYGYKGASNKEDWLIEVPENADPMEDQFEKTRNDKKDRVRKNKKQQERNENSALAQQKGMSVAEIRALRKNEIKNSIKTSRVSTASMGRFDKKVETSGIMKIPQGKRRFEPVVGAVESEKARAQHLLSKISA